MRTADPDEQCDAGPDNSTNPGACRPDCTAPFCGDAIEDPGEQCDDGTDNADAPDTCRLTCQVPRCGDDIVDDLSGETCDDENGVDNDGCRNSCHLEGAPLPRVQGDTLLLLRFDGSFEGVDGEQPDFDPTGSFIEGVVDDAWESPGFGASAAYPVQENIDVDQGTWEAWVWHPLADTQELFLVSDASAQFIVVIDDTHKIRVVRNGFPLVETPAEPAFGARFVHLAVTWSVTEVAVYIDGALVDGALGLASLVPTPTTFVAATAGGVRYDELRITDRPLSAAEIVADYDLGAPGVY